MTENTTLLLALVSATLIALDRQLRTGTWPAWLKIPGWGRALVVILVGVLSAAVESWLGGGGTFVHSLLVAGGVAVPALVTLLLHPEQAKSAAVLVLMVCGLSQTGCTGSLQQQRLQGQRMRAVGTLSAASADRCESLDNQYRWAGAIGKVAAAGAVSAASIAASGQIEDERVERGLIIGAAVSGAIGAGALLLSESSAESHAKECGQ